MTEKPKPELEVELSSAPTKGTAAWYREQLIAIAGIAEGIGGQPNYWYESYGGDDRDMAAGAHELVLHAFQHPNERVETVMEALKKFFEIWDGGSRDQFLSNAVAELRANIFGPHVLSSRREL